jgi:protein O-GlcNAc transferase
MNRKQRGFPDKSNHVPGNARDAVRAHLLHGSQLGRAERYLDALTCFDSAIALDSALAEAWLGRGNCLSALGRVTEALAAYDRALGLRGDFLMAWLARSNLLMRMGRYPDAAVSYDQVLAATDILAQAWFGRGTLHAAANEREQAVVSFKRALAIQPNYASAKWALCMAELPVLFRDEEDIHRQRKIYAERLTSLAGEFESGGISAELAGGIGSMQPFYLAYQGQDNRELQSIYGGLICNAMRKKFPQAILKQRSRSPDRIRIGVVSGYFYGHSVWKIPIKGWITQLDRQRFEVFGYHTSARSDEQTQFAARTCERFVRGPMAVADWRRTILDDAPDVLIFPEVGMDPVSVQLAAQRLAPVQCNSWGHPDTSGFPTLDYYLSSDLMEPPDAQDYYSERLVRLPNLSVYYEPVDRPHVALSRADVGFRADAVVYWCGQSLPKYLPQFDGVFPKIACAVKNCQFVFIRHETDVVNELFNERLARAFNAHGLDMTDHCVMLARLDIRWRACRNAGFARPIFGGEFCAVGRCERRHLRDRSRDAGPGPEYAGAEPCLMVSEPYR